jgi:hypothetical protein
MTPAQIDVRLAELLLGNGDENAGAQLVVTGADGDETFRAALARHWRRDLDDPQLIWIRPVVGHVDALSHPPAFSLSVARRRGLQFVTVHEDGHDLVFTLASGDTAHVTRATGPMLADLHAWDSWVYTALTADEERALDALDADSWHGQWA